MRHRLAKFSPNSIRIIIVAFVAAILMGLLPNMSFAQTPSPSPTESSYQSPTRASLEQANATLPNQLQMNIPEVVAEVTAAFKRYEQALVTNDVPVLDELFFNSPNTVRYGATEELVGYGAIQEFRSQRSPKNLARDLRNTIITTYGRDFAVASTEFTRTTSLGKIGRQQQTWVRTKDGWKVVAAQVSTRDVPK